MDVKDKLSRVCLQVAGQEVEIKTLQRDVGENKEGVVKLQRQIRDELYRNPDSLNNRLRQVEDTQLTWQAQLKTIIALAGLAGAVVGIAINILGFLVQGG